MQKHDLVQLLFKTQKVLRTRNTFVLSEDVIDTYYESLCEFNYDDLDRAIRYIIAHDNYFPTVARIREIAERKETLSVKREIAIQTAWRKISSALAIAKDSCVAFDDVGIHYAISSIDMFYGWKIGRDLYEKTFTSNESYDTHNFNEWKKNVLNAYGVFLDLFLSGGLENNVLLSYPSYLLGNNEKKTITIGDTFKSLSVMEGGFNPKPETFEYTLLSKDSTPCKTNMLSEKKQAENRVTVEEQLNKIIREETINYFTSSVFALPLDSTAVWKLDRGISWIGSAKKFIQMVLDCDNNIFNYYLNEEFVEMLTEAQKKELFKKIWSPVMSVFRKIAVV